MYRRVRRVIAGAGLCLVLATAAAPAALAHPLGNFTVNRYARLELSREIQVLYVLDEAEIPAFQDRESVESDPDRFAVDRLNLIATRLDLRVDGRRVPLELLRHDLTRPPGQGGLPTLRLAAAFGAPSLDLKATQPYRVTFRDENEPDRVGWREIVVKPQAKAALRSSDAPQADVSDELRNYPEDLTSSPLERRSAEFSFIPGAEVGDEIVLVPPTNSNRPVDGFASLITTRALSPGVLVGLFASAFTFGAAHALGPGHGKTVMAAYLVGTRGRRRDALLLGAIVSLMHTASVLVLGLILVRLGRSVALERIYPALNAASGAVIAGIGIWLLVSRSRTAGGAPASHAHNHETHDHKTHDHAHADYELVAAVSVGAASAHAVDQLAQPVTADYSHSRVGSHEHGPFGSHSHELGDGVAPLSRRGLIALATSGGLFPSPTAVVVLISSFALGRAALGLSLLVAFSIGLAATLTAVGLALVYGRELVARSRFAGAIRVLPAVGALGLIVAGTILLIGGAAAL